MKDKHPIHNRNWKPFLLKVLILTLAALVVLHFANVAGFLRGGIRILTPFIIGLGIAYIWNLLLEPIERRLFKNRSHSKINRFRRPISVVLSLLIILAIIALVLYLVIPQLYNSIMIIAEAVPVLTQNLKNWFLEVSEGLNWTESLRNNIENLEVNWGEWASRAVDFLRTRVGGFLGSTINIVGNVVGFFVSAFTALLFAVYVLFSKEKLGRQLHNTGRAYLHRPHRGRIEYVLHILDETFSNFFRGQVLDAVAVGVLLMIAMLILRMPYAVTIGVVVMVTALIPMIGAFIGGAVGFLMIAVLSIQQALLFLVVLVIVQQLEGDLIYPKIVGDSIGLPGIWVFAAVIVGGAIAGPLGMIIGVPLTAALYKILRNDVKQRNDQEGEHEEHPVHVE